MKVVITGSRPTPADFEKYPKFIFFDGFIEERYSPEQLERVTVISEPFFTYSKWKANGDTLSDSDRKAIVGVVEKWASRFVFGPLRIIRRLGRLCITWEWM